MGGGIGPPPPHFLSKQKKFLNLHIKKTVIDMFSTTFWARVRNKIEKKKSEINVIGKQRYLPPPSPRIRIEITFFFIFNFFGRSATQPPLACRSGFNVRLKMKSLRKISIASEVKVPR